MLFDSLYQELALGIDIIRPLVTGLTEAEARYKPSPDTWSILEVICHLYDEERKDFRQRLDIMLHRPHEPLPPIDPMGWVTARGYNERDLGQMWEKFAAERAQSLIWLKGLSEPDWEAVYITPYRSMKAGDMFTAWVAHDNLHVRQLVELRRSRLINLTTPYNVDYAGEW